MIGSLRGVLLERWPSGEVLVEVAGVGYLVTVAPTTALSIGEPGDSVFLYVHHYIREDAEVLYGFTSTLERTTFLSLLGTHGVGPTLALAILSVHDPAGLARIVASDDLDGLCLVPGVGKKTATRLLVELRSRLDLDQLGADAEVTSRALAGTPASEVREALAGLGYGPDEVHSILKDLPDEGDTESLLREALRRLAVS